MALDYFSFPPEKGRKRVPLGFEIDLNALCSASPSFLFPTDSKQLVNRSTMSAPEVNSVGGGAAVVIGASTMDGMVMEGL